MRHGIFADIHANLEAWRAVREDLHREKVEHFLCLGDLVGYGADPELCIAEVRELKPQSVCGNHDRASIGLRGIEYFNPVAKEAVIWTRNHLTDDGREYLRNQRLVETTETFTLVHGSLKKPEEFEYLLDAASATACFRQMETPLCFVGHSHRPAIFFQDKNDLIHGMEFQKKIPTAENHVRVIAKRFSCYRKEPKITLSSDKKYIINVGSVGQPRDGDRRASYFIWDDEENAVELRRVEYDIEKAQNKIIRAGLPAPLAVRLGEGR